MTLGRSEIPWPSPVVSCSLLSALKGLILQELHPGKTRRQQLLLLALLLERGLLLWIGGRRLSLPPLTLCQGQRNPLQLCRLVKPVVRNLLRPVRGLSMNLMDEGRLHLCPSCGGGSWACPCPSLFHFCFFSFFICR